MPQAESLVQCDHTQVQSTGSDSSNNSNSFQVKVGGVWYNGADLRQVGSDVIMDKDS